MTHLADAPMIRHRQGFTPKRRPGGVKSIEVQQRVFSASAQCGNYASTNMWAGTILHRYLGEFDFRSNARKMKGGESAVQALKSTMMEGPSASPAL